LEDNSLSPYRLFSLPITTLNANALAECKLTKKEVDRCKNFYALGPMYWLYDRPMKVTLDWISSKFRNPEVAKANMLALKAGYNYGETTEMFNEHYHVNRAQLAPGRYRNITGNEATAVGFVTASHQIGLPLFYASYPITPASDILHELSKLQN